MDAIIAQYELLLDYLNIVEGQVPQGAKKPRSDEKPEKPEEPSAELPSRYENQDLPKPSRKQVGKKKGLKKVGVKDLPMICQ